MNSGGYVRWLLRVLGVLLALGGATAMVRGWDIVQVERGWSLVIAGAVAFSGGAVVIALAEVVSRLDRLLAKAQIAEATTQRPHASEAQRDAEAAPAQPAAPPAPPKAAPAPSAAPGPAPEGVEPAPAPPLAQPAPFRPFRAETSGLKARFKPPAAPAPAPLPEGVREIERYQSGGLTYVMFSDGSVELRSEAGAQRFSSIEELRTVLATQE